MRSLDALLMGHSAQRSIWLTVALILLFILYSATLAWAGYERGYRTAERAAGDTIAALRAENATAIQRSLESANARLLETARKANDLATALSSEQSANAKLARQLRDRSQHVNREYRQALDDPVQPVPAAVFTIGWLRHYNTALGADPLPEPFATAAALTAPERAAEFDSLESGVTAQDILDHAATYGAWCLDNAAQVNRLLDHHEVMR